MNLRLTLYGRSQCHLCEAMHEELLPLARTHGFDVERVDIDKRPELEAYYGCRIPVLAHGNVELCHHFLDPEAVLDYINKHIS